MKKNKIRISMEEKLESIYKYEIEGKDDHYTQAMNAYSSFNLTNLESLVLSGMYHYKNIKLDMDEFAKKIGKKKTEVVDSLESLYNKGYLEKKHNLDKDSIFYDFPIFINPEEKIKTLFSKLNENVRNLSSLKLEISEFVDYCEALFCRYQDTTFCDGYSALAEKLTVNEKAALLVLANEFVKKGITPYEINNNQNVYEGVEGLIEKAVAVVVYEKSSSDDDEKTDKYLLSPKSCKALFCGQKNLVRLSKMSHQADILTCEDIKEKELFFDSENEDVINDLYKILDKKKYEEYTRNVEAKGRNNGIMCLLYGPPGTGKTEVSKQLAKKSGRDIIIVDTSKIYGSLWGETEKNCKALFRTFKYLNAVSGNAPILLFNEADGIINKRIDARSGIEKSENSLQSILLNELEQFEGFFIATTNLQDNIDSAFDRRFLYKVELKKPSVAISSKIWKAHIPSLSDEDAIELAETYDFSGGQIENIAKKCDIHECLNLSFPTKDELIAFCKAEERISKKENYIKIKGFNDYLNNYE